MTIAEQDWTDFTWGLHGALHAMQTATDVVGWITTEPIPEWQWIVYYLEARQFARFVAATDPCVN